MIIHDIATVIYSVRCEILVQHHTIIIFCSLACLIAGGLMFILRNATMSYMENNWDDILSDVRFQ